MAHHRTTPVREVSHQPSTSALTSHNWGLLTRAAAIIAAHTLLRVCLA
jgi:hypothetical protein